MLIYQLMDFDVSLLDDLKRNEEWKWWRILRATWVVYSYHGSFELRIGSLQKWFPKVIYFLFWVFCLVNFLPVVWCKYVSKLLLGPIRKNFFIHLGSILASFSNSSSQIENNMLLASTCDTVVMHTNTYAIHSDGLSAGNIFEKNRFFNLLDLLPPKELLRRHKWLSKVPNILLQVRSRCKETCPVLVSCICIREKVIPLDRPTFKTGIF